MEVFSRRIASRLPKFSMCAGCTLSSTAAWGITSRDKGSISPGWLVPTSHTARSARREQRASDSGTPMWLFRLPAVANAPSALAAKDLNVVLPLLPVTATTGPVNRWRAAAANVHKPSSVSSTRSVGAP